MATSNKVTITDCRTEEGVTVGLIDSLMSIAQAILDRGVRSVAGQEALKDLQSNEALRLLLTIDPEQSWFWTPEWQAREKATQADIASGNYKEFATMEEFLAEMETSDDE